MAPYILAGTNCWQSAIVCEAAARRMEALEGTSMFHLVKCMTWYLQPQHFFPTHWTEGRLNFYNATFFSKEDFCCNVVTMETVSMYLILRRFFTTTGWFNINVERTVLLKNPRRLQCAFWTDLDPLLSLQDNILILLSSSFYCVYDSDK